MLAEGSGIGLSRRGPWRPLNVACGLSERRGGWLVFVLIGQLGSHGDGTCEAGQGGRGNNASQTLVSHISDSDQPGKKRGWWP